MSSLAEKLEVWGFEEGRFIFKDMSLGAILKINPRDISCATDEELNALHQVATDFLNGLPAGLSLQFVQMIEQGGANLIQAHSALSTTQMPLVERMLSERQNRLKHLDEEGMTPVQAMYIILRRPFKKSVRKKKFSFSFWKKSFEEEDFTRDTIEPELRSFSQVLEQVSQGLETLGLASTLVQEDAAFSLLFDQWNPTYPLEGVNFNCEDIRDDLILSDMVMSLKGFALGRIHHRILSLKIMPEHTFSSMSEKLRDLPFGSRLHLSVEVLDQDKETLILETQRRIAYAMYAGKKGVSDLESEAKLKDIEALLSGRVSGQEKIFSAALNVVLRHENEEELENQVAAVLQLFRELSGAEGMVESLAAGSMFLEFSLPNARAKERSRRMNTSVLADFLPIYGDWPGHDEPRVILRNRRGSLLGFDPFSPRLTNFNQIVSGGSGAGKSFRAPCRRCA